MLDGRLNLITLSLSSVRRATAFSPNIILYTGAIVIWILWLGGRVVCRIGRRQYTHYALSRIHTAHRTYLILFCCKMATSLTNVVRVYCTQVEQHGVIQCASYFVNPWPVECRTFPPRHFSPRTFPPLQLGHYPLPTKCCHVSISKMGWGNVRLNVNVMLSNIAVNTKDKLQFLVLIFADLLSKLCNVSLHKVY